MAASPREHAHAVGQYAVAHHWLVRGLLARRSRAGFACAREPDLARSSTSSTFTSISSPSFSTSVDLLDALVGHLRDVEQAVGARQDLDERAEVDDLAHGALVDRADLGLRREALDDVDRLLSTALVGRRDRSPCRRPRRRSCDPVWSMMPLIVLPPGPMMIADLVGLDLACVMRGAYFEDLGRGVGERRPSCSRMKSRAFARLLERLLHDRRA